MHPCISTLLSSCHPLGPILSVHSMNQGYSPMVELSLVDRSDHVGILDSGLVVKMLILLGSKIPHHIDPRHLQDQLQSRKIQLYIVCIVIQHCALLEQRMFLWGKGIDDLCGSKQGSSILPDRGSL